MAISTTFKQSFVTPLVSIVKGDTKQDYTFHTIDGVEYAIKNTHQAVYTLSKRLGLLSQIEAKTNTTWNLVIKEFVQEEPTTNTKEITLSDVDVRVLKAIHDSKTYSNLSKYFTVRENHIFATNGCDGVVFGNTNNKHLTDDSVPYAVLPSKPAKTNTLKFDGDLPPLNIASTMVEMGGWEPKANYKTCDIPITSLEQALQLCKKDPNVINSKAVKTVVITLVNTRWGFKFETPTESACFDDFNSDADTFSVKLGVASLNRLVKIAKTLKSRKVFLRVDSGKPVLFSFEQFSHVFIAAQFN